MSEQLELREYTRDNVMKAVRKMMFPIAMQCLLASIVSATDAIMLGALNQQSLAAVTLAGQLMQIFSFLIMSISVGTTALSAQYWGKKDADAVGRVLHIALKVSIAAGTIFMLACLVAPGVVMSFYTSDSEMIEMGITYLRYVGVSYLFMGFSQIYLIIMKNTNRITAASSFGAITVILNIILNAILIFGLLGAPEMGIAGAALATTISRGVEFVLTLIASNKQSTVMFKPKMLFRSYKTLKRKFWRYTLPSVLQLTSWMMATSATMAILGHLSSEAVAASAVALIAFNIAASFATAYGNSTGIVIGQQLGCGDIEEAKVCGDKLLKGAALLGLVLCIVVCALSPVIPKYMSTLNDEAKRYLLWMLIIVGIKCIGKAVNHTLATGILSAGGDVKFLLKLDIINMWLIILPLGLISAFLLKLSPVVVYLLVNLDEYTKMYTELKHYKKYLWAKDLTKKEWADPGQYDKELREKIVERMPMGAIVLGSSGKITMSNPAAERILGISESDLEGEPLAVFTLKDERNLDFVQCIMDAVYDKTTVNDVIVDFYNKDAAHELQINTSFIEEEDANLGVLILIYDVEDVINGLQG